MPLIETKDLVKKFDNFTAVKKINFHIQQGEIFGLLGPNGAGKTTTISMLSTLLKPSNGDAFISGHSVVEEPLLVRQIIGVVPQEIALYDDLTAEENLKFWGRMYRMSGKELTRQIEKVLEQIGLTDRKKDRVETYSGGMKRRLNIGVGLLHQPQLLFMDEPTVGIDPQSRRKILDTVIELNQQGLTVLYTTHYMEEAQELSHRVGIIDHGEMIAIGNQQELTEMVGEYDTMRLHIQAQEDGQQLAARLKEIPEIIEASTADHEIVIITPTAEDVLPTVINIANQLNIKIRSIDIQEPNLEAVFLHLTGRALRD
ncbi:MAG: export ABC transporter ATP-binding protein [Anaerolineaceae bacterium]|nr:export ABC transporter ATP-binding protein [Anaerolineaceae bacterium]